MTFTIDPIGVIHSPFKEKENCPIQGVYANNTAGKVEVYSPHDAGLKYIEGFSHIYLIYHFDRAGDIKYVRPTFLDDTPHGIYASRHPCRPNGIGMSIVKLVDRDANKLAIEGVDVLDQTPLLDIKPYIPRFDCFDSATEGWVGDKAFRAKPPDRE